jgi:heterodisulfide reductase subunit A
MEEEIRIGVFVCHCGLNIGGVVDSESVAKYAATLPNVTVSVDNKYTCSDPGQEEIKKHIKEYNLNRVVVASCSPRMHEPTFRRTVEEAGLNKYLFEMTNIREHVSWVHMYEPEKATEKAKDLVRMAVMRAALLKPLPKKEVPIIDRALVIGGGVTGLNTALDLAKQGFKTYIVEKTPTIGGHMAMLDKTFPTLDCSICILAPMMVDAGNHPNIEILTYSEVAQVDGFVGNFKVKVKKKPRYVDMDLCNGCGDCGEICPVRVPNVFDVNLGMRGAAYVPFPQAVPLKYTIDPESCLHLNYGICGTCQTFCPKQAIDFNQNEEEVELDVGTIIVATGYESYDPTPKREYGYGVYKNVITNIEFERIKNAAGPTRGHLVRPSDGKVPHRIGFIQCVGSRDYRVDHKYCSNVCCMISIKQAVQIKEKYPDAEVYIFAIDIRAFGKGFEEIYRRARDMGIVFIKGRASEVIEDPETDNLILSAEDLYVGKQLEFELDMVVLATALLPGSDAKELANTLNISLGADGFFAEAHPKLRPIDTFTDGVFLAGCAQGPKDIPECVAQGKAAASAAASLMARGKIEIEAITANVDEELCIGCELCTLECSYGAIQMTEENKAKVIEDICKGCGTCAAACPQFAIYMKHYTDEQVLAQIRAAMTDIKERPLILAFTCNWCSYGGADLAGISRFQYPTNVRIIRLMCSGRVDPSFIYEAFRLGADGVLISGCHLGDCHYATSNYRTKMRFVAIQHALKQARIDPRRLRLEWISASEGESFANTIREMVEELKELPPLLTVPKMEES